MIGRRMRHGGLLAASVVVLLGVLVVGLAAYARQLTVGEIATSMRTLGSGGVVWGLYIVMDGCCLGAGVALMACACLARFSNDRDLEAVARIAMPAALTCFLAATLTVMADQGRPLASLWHLATVARPQSPLFATSTAVGAICLFGSLVHCVLARRADLAIYARRASFWRPLQRLLSAGYHGSAAQRWRRQRVGFWMSLLMLPGLAVPLAALAIAFTVRPGRPLLVAVSEAIGFTLAAGAGGVAVLVVAAALVGRLAGPTAGLSPRGFARLGRGLMLVDVLAALSVVIAVAAGLSSRDPATVAWARSLLGAPYGGLLWAQLALFLLPAALLLWADFRRRLQPGLVVTGGVGSAVAVFLHAYGALIPWQTHGLPLPYPPGAYWPSATEVAVLAGIVALSLLLLLPSVRLIPFAPVAHPQTRLPAPPSDPRRGLVTALWLGLGLGLTAVGLTLSLRVATDPFRDPVVLGSPALFVVGLMILVTTGAVYEVLPDRPGESRAANTE